MMLEASFDARYRAGRLDLSVARGRSERCRHAAGSGASGHHARAVDAGRARRRGAADWLERDDGLLRDRVERVANTNFTVLIEGESGVGKELVARQIHELGPRRQGPFVAINCAALVETLIEAELFGIEERTATGVRGRRGKFEHADGGTLFLDEISDLSMAAQAKLLRVIQDLTVERVGGIGPAPNQHTHCRGHQSAALRRWSIAGCSAPICFTG